MHFEDNPVRRPIELARLKSHAFLLPVLGQGRRIRLERVEAGVGVRRGVVPFEQLAQRAFAPARVPAAAKPVRVGITERRLGLFQILEQLLSGLVLPAVTAQQRVEEAGLRPEAELFGHLDGLVDGRVVGDAVEPEHLIKAQTQQDLERSFLLAAVGFACDEPVERGFPSDHAAGQLVDQAAIHRRERVGGKFPLQEGLQELGRLRMLLQNAYGNLSWFFHGHCLIMPVA